MFPQQPGILGWFFAQPASQGQRDDHTLGVNGLILQITLEFWQGRSVDVVTYYNSLSTAIIMSVIKSFFKERNIWVPDRNRTHGLPNPWPPEHLAGALSTELQELMESKVI